MNKHVTISVLFVCMGNICRSPTAEAVFRKLVSDAGLGDVIHVSSAGTHAYHAGEAPDRRARDAATRRGYTLEAIRARRITHADFEAFDYIVAMDENNLAILREQSGEQHAAKLSLLLEHAESSSFREVPDPYYGGSTGFEQVLDLVEQASRALLKTIRQRL